MKIATIVGARPQFIKAAPLSNALKQAGHSEFLIHTGQHYDYEMSKIFFDQLGIREPSINLEVGSGHHGRQTANMLLRIEEVLLAERPDWVVVYGDTNSTLAGAIAACKLRIRLAHIEAGLRSFNREMPEEHNRVVADHCSDLLFCPTETAVKNLAREGITAGARLVGDTMYDAVLQFGDVAQHHSTILKDMELEPRHYMLATVHRAYNTDEPANLLAILKAFADIGETIIFPVHPRTRQKIRELAPQQGDARHGDFAKNIRMIEPVGYLDMLLLEKNASLILTDSGGIQKEAYFFEVPCVTLRPETEWIETVEDGWNVLTGADSQKIVSAATGSNLARRTRHGAFGDGRAAQKIVSSLEQERV